MKLTLLSRLKSKKDFCYILDVVFNNNILISHDSSGISILNKDLNELYNFYLEVGVLIDSYYLSDDRSKLLVYDSSSNYLYYVNLIDPIFKPIKYELSKEFILDMHYVWDNNAFIINESSDVFIKYNIENHDIEILNRDLIDIQYPGFSILFNLKTLYKVIYQDIKQQVFIYRTVDEETNIIFWKDFGINKEIQFLAPMVDIFAAQYLGNLLVLMHEEYVFLYNVDKEIHRLEVKQPYYSLYARLFKGDNLIYLVSLTARINSPNRSYISLYKIEDYKQDIWSRIAAFFRKN